MGSGQITFQDHTGKWWVPTAYGLFRFPKSTVQQLAFRHPEAVYGVRNGLPGGVFVSFEDSRGDIWVSTQIPGIGSRLSRWERATGQIKSYSVSDGVPLIPLARAFTEDREGNVWIGFDPAFRASKVFDCYAKDIQVCLRWS